MQQTPCSPGFCLYKLLDVIFRHQSADRQHRVNSLLSHDASLLCSTSLSFSDFCNGWNEVNSLLSWNSVRYKGKCQPKPRFTSGFHTRNCNILLEDQPSFRMAFQPPKQTKASWKSISWSWRTITEQLRNLIWQNICFYLKILSNWNNLKSSTKT